MATLTAKINDAQINDSESIIHIDEYEIEKHKGKIQCRQCSGEVIAKRGQINAHHFAHRVKNCDAWKSEPMTQWHKGWQEYAKKEDTEIRVQRGEVWHIADIQLPDGKTIEIQHSNLSVTQVAEREAFYYQLNWILHGKASDVLINTGQAVFMKCPKWWNAIQQFAVIDVDGNMFQLLRINCPKDNYCIGLPIDRNEFVEDLLKEYMSGKDPFPTATPLPIHAGITFQIQQPPNTDGKASQGLLYFQGATFPVKDPLKCAGFIWRDRSWIGATENLINFSQVSLEQLRKSSKKDRGQFIPCYICGKSATWSERADQLQCIPNRGISWEAAAFCENCRTEVSYKSGASHSEPVVIKFTDGQVLMGFSTGGWS